MLWTFPEKINEELVRYLFTLDFLAHKGNAAFLGPTGVGKTHLMSALGLHACTKGYTVHFDTAANIINRLVAAQTAGNIVPVLKSYRKPYEETNNKGMFHILFPRIQTAVDNFGTTSMCHLLKVFQPSAVGQRAKAPGKPRLDQRSSGIPMRRPAHRWGCKIGGFCKIAGRR